MFKLIMLLIIFLAFVANYFFWYIYTMPYFKFITRFNFYEYLQYKINNRKVDKVLYKSASSDNDYILDYSGFILKTDLKYLSRHGYNTLLYIPVFILHTWSDIKLSWDKLFTWLQVSQDFNWYYQYISWWNDYIDIGTEIRNNKKYKQTLYLWYLYLYCSMAWTKWIDAYYFDRYKNYNKKLDDKNESSPAWTYVCPNNSNIWEYKKKVCVEWGWFSCKRYEYKTYQACACDNKWEYKICKKNTNYNDSPDGNPDKKDCKKDGTKCIPYTKGTINLNDTNCSLSWLSSSSDVKSKYFLLR